jgi:serine/threonine protein kinase
MIVARVADGAMGRVYEARHPDTRERVAIKVLHEPVACDHVAVERFKREFETARELDNPYIVKVFELGQSGGSYYMIMEFLTGETLARAIAHRESLPFALSVRLVCQLALALEHAHSYGFIHRDLKPENLFLCDSSEGMQLRVLDFGSVKLQVETSTKLTAFGTTIGSPYYVSPEQATASSSVDQRSDVFALGAICYEMLTGAIAFDGATIAQILQKILRDSPAPPSSRNPHVPAEVDAAVAQALHKRQRARYPTARAFAEALVVGFGLRPAPCETWAMLPLAEIATQLVHAQGAGRSRLQPSAAATTRLADLHPLPASVGAASDATLRVPMQTMTRKHLIGVALALFVLALVVFGSR